MSYKNYSHTFYLVLLLTCLVNIPAHAALYGSTVATESVAPLIHHPNVVSSEEIIRLAAMGKKKSGTKEIGRILGVQNLPNSVLEDAYLRIAIQQGKISRTEAMDMMTSCSLSVLDNEIRKVGVQVEQQSMLINRSLGKVIPLVLPEDIENEIASIEDRLRVESKRPRDINEIQQLSDQLAGVVNKLPPWAQEEELPRLVPRRWEIEALWILASEPSTKDAESLSTYVSSIESHLAKKPTNSFDDIEKLLENKMQLAKVEIPKLERSAAIDRAKQAIKNKKDFELATRQLVVYEDGEAKSILKELNDIILQQSFAQEISLVEKDIDRYEKLSDAPLREYAFVRSNQAVMDLRLRITSSEVKDDSPYSLDKRISDLEKRVARDIKGASDAKQLRDAEKLKRYQVWALGEIKQIRSLKDIEEIEISKIPDKYDRANPLSNTRTKAKEQAWRVLIDELVLHMAPINQALLEPAVSQWFAKVYEKQFNDLSNDIGQLEIVTRFATATKKTIESL